MANGIGNLPTTPTPQAHVTVVDQLRGPDLTVVRIAPRPPFPEQHATRKPLPHDLDAWWTAATEALAGAA